MRVKYILFVLSIIIGCSEVSAQRDSLLQEAVVTGQYAPQSLRQSVFRVRTITREQIRQRGATDVLGTLNTMTGIRFSPDATLGETDIQLMGISGQEVKILLDGIPLVDRGATRQSLSQIDINNIERIEVVEGPMSVVYGSDALAGVINIITRNPMRQSGGSGRWRAGARVQEETMGDEYHPFTDHGLHHESVNAGWQNGHWDIAGSLTRNHSGGWQGDTTGRAKEWMPKDQTFGGGTIGFRAGGLSALYRVDYLNETLKSLGNYFPPNYTTTDAWYITHRWTHTMQADWAAGPAMVTQRRFLLAGLSAPDTDDPISIS